MLPKVDQWRNLRGMLHLLLKRIETTCRWIIVSITLLFLAEELVRVTWYVIGEWGFADALVDGAVLYKLGEAAIIVPLLLLVHWIGVWSAEKSERFVRKMRWPVWFGGILTLAASFDLYSRVFWAWWAVLLTVMAVLLPPAMGFLSRRRAVWRGRILATCIVLLLLCLYAASFVFTGHFITPLPGPHPSPAASADGRWQQDLEYLAENLPRLHLNAFHTVQKERFEHEVAQLHDAIPAMDSNEIKVGLHRIVALVGDGHTSITSWNTPSAGRLPIRFYWLDDGLFVTAVTEANRDILGGKVLRLGDLTVDSAFGAVCSLLPNESDNYLLHHSVRYLVDIDMLRGLDIADDSGHMAITVVSGESDTIQTIIKPVNSSDGHQFIRLPDSLPLYRSRSDAGYWSEFYDDINTAYLKYNSFSDPVGFSGFTDEFWAKVDSNSVEYVIVDFRENGGGYSACFDDFYENIIAHDNINRNGHLYHLTNRRTYSSASLYTGIIRRDTEAILAGEMMGGGLNRYGDMRMFKLPNSGIEVSYSTKYFELWPDTIPPFAMDILINPSSVDYFAGEDPVLDSVFQLIRQSAAAER